MIIMHFIAAFFHQLITPTESIYNNFKTSRCKVQTDGHKHTIISLSLFVFELQNNTTTMKSLICLHFYHISHLTYSAKGQYNYLHVADTLTQKIFKIVITSSVFIYPLLGWAILHLIFHIHYLPILDVLNVQNVMVFISATSLFSRNAAKTTNNI